MPASPSERQPLLPSYSPSVARLRREGVAAAPAWPATFEEGVDARMASPAAMVRTPKSPFSSPFVDRQRLKQQAVVSVEEGTPHGHSSFKGAVFNAINVLLGVGVLSSPFALRSSGWLLGAPLFLFFTLVTNHTAKLLGKCLDYQEGMLTYPDIGEAAFGTKGRVIISITFFCELFTVCAMLFVVIGDTLAALIPSFTEAQLTIIAFLVIMPSTWTTQMSMLSYFSILGVVSSLFCLYTILYVGFAIDVTAPGYSGGSLLHPQPIEMLADTDRIPLAIGLTMVAFGGHSVFPSICSSLENKASYPRVVDVAYVVVAFVYGIIELGGYLMYGVDTKKEITLNLIASFPGALTTLVIWMIVLNPLSKIAITIHPIALAIEEFVLSRGEMMAPTSRKTAFYRAFIRTSITIAAVFCGLFVPHFARLTSFLGAFFAMMVSLFFPCVFYLKLFWRRLSRFEVVLNVTLAALSIVFSFIGTIASFISPAD